MFVVCSSDRAISSHALSQVSIVETAGDAFITVTESKHDHLGHLEVPIDDYVVLSADSSLEQSYPQLAELRKLFNENIWAVIFPPKKPAAVVKPVSEAPLEPLPQHHQQPYRHSYPHPLGGPVSPFDYGRSDLDPFGIGSDPLRGGIGRGGGGGMLFDPRRPLRDDRPLYPGAPPLAGPPGARIDPIMPFAGRPAARGRGAPPDPDMPGWEDMYL